jgi:glycosyltransferase involved in cell wall biosynthesis
LSIAGPLGSNDERGLLVLVSGRDPIEPVNSIGNYAVAHAQAARAAGFTPHIFSVADRSSTTETGFAILHRVASPVRPVRGISSILQRPWLARAITHCLAGRPGPHVIHGLGPWTDSAVAASRSLGRCGVRAVPIGTAYMTIVRQTAAKLDSSVVRGNLRLNAAHQRELLWVRAVTAGVERRSYRSAHTVVVNYESVRRALDDAYGPGLNIRRLPYAAVTAFREDAEPHAQRPPMPEPLAQLGHDDELTIVSVSRHDGRKGVDVLLHALAGLHRAGIRFRACLVGDGPLLAAHRRLTSELGLDGLVSVPGQVSDVVPYLRHSDIFVLPSLEEGSGSESVLEAMQAGVPVVASGVDGIPEDLTDGVEALLVQPGDAESLRRPLERLLASADLRAELGAAARRRYEECFSPPIVIEALRTFYGELGLVPADFVAR